VADQTTYREVKEVRGRRVVDYYELAEPLEEAREELGFKTFAEFSRQIARQFLKEYDEQKNRDKLREQLKGEA
jgi:hypothetical protein